MSDLWCVITRPERANKRRSFYNAPELQQVRLSIIQSNLTKLYDMPAFPTGIIKVSSALAQKEPKYIFHHCSQFIIHGNHLKSGVLRLTNVHKHASPADSSAFQTVHRKCSPINCTPQSAVYVLVTAVTSKGGSSAADWEDSSIIPLIRNVPVIVRCP